ncbi:MAG: YihY/virulence factor BrkB family protein [Proteobacteria bacterium]|nr:YihY/virulence factor BrkB family protein [Pseudomonadota bacterium]MBU4356424.1 YihY/virulence factor BrkB family protein [Pseudomonadota bacterium]
MTHKESKSFYWFQHIWELLKETYVEWRKDNAPQLGAALAFYTIFSLAPLFIIIIAVIGYFLGKESVQVYMTKEMTEFVGRDNAMNIMMMIEKSHNPGSGVYATILAFILMLFGSSFVVVMLKNAMNAMWGVKQYSSGIITTIKDRLISCIIVLLLIFISFLLMISSSLLAAIKLYLSSSAPIPIIFFQAGDIIFSLLILTLIFAVLYKFLPDVTISWGDVWVGGAVTALLFTLGKIFLGSYIGRISISSAYGAAGSLVVMLLWVYYSAQIIFVGAEFTQVYAKKYGREIRPRREE